MDQLKGALTSKIGPFPGWAWAGLTAVGLFLLWPHLSGILGSGSSSSSTSAPDVAPGDQSSSAGSAVGPPAVTPPPPSASGLNAYGLSPAVWAGLTEHQKEYWKLHHKILPAARGGAGIGGGSIGSRSAVLMTPFHPDLGRTVRYPQLVLAAGGPAAHRSELHRVAAQAGVHPARLIALNPHYRGLIRVA